MNRGKMCNCIHSPVHIRSLLLHLAPDSYPGSSLQLQDWIIFHAERRVFGNHKALDEILYPITEVSSVSSDFLFSQELKSILLILFS